MVGLKLVGANISNLSAKRDLEFKGEISMKTDVKIIGFELVKDAKNTIKVSYGFKVNFGDLGEVVIEGNLYLSADSKTIKNMQKSWKNQKFDTEEQMAITNLIIKKASIKAFALEEELGLPIHIRLPTVKLKEDK